MKNSAAVLLEWSAFIILTYLFVIFSSLYVYPYSGDYVEYLQNFLGDGGERFELGYRALVAIFTSIFQRNELNFLIFLSILSFTSVFIKAYAFKVSVKTNIFLFSIVYLPIFFLLHEANQVRISFALGIALFGIAITAKGYRKTSFCVFIVAILFHYSVVLLSVFYVYYYFYDKRNLVKLLTLIISLFFFLLVDISFLSEVNPLVDKYLKANLEYRFHPVYILLLVLIMVIGFKRSSKQTVFQDALLNTFFTIFCIAYSLSFAPIIAVRVMDISCLVAFFYVFSLKLTLKLSMLILYFLIFVISISRFFIFITTDTIYRFPQ